MFEYRVAHSCLAEMASKIAEKKTARQVRDLQEQLQRERAMRGAKGTPSMENLAAATSAAAKGGKRCVYCYSHSSSYNYNY